MTRISRITVVPALGMLLCRLEKALVWLVTTAVVDLGIFFRPQFPPPARTVWLRLTAARAILLSNSNSAHTQPAATIMTGKSQQCTELLPAQTPRCCGHVGGLLAIGALVGICFVHIQIVYGECKRHVWGNAWDRSIVVSA